MCIPEDGGCMKHIQRARWAYWTTYVSAITGFDEVVVMGLSMIHTGIARPRLRPRLTHLSKGKPVQFNLPVRERHMPFFILRAAVHGSCMSLGLICYRLVCLRLKNRIHVQVNLS